MDRIRYPTDDHRLAYSPVGIEGNSSRKGGMGSHGYRPWKSKYTGTGKTSLKLYLRQFEMVANYNDWDASEKALQLVASLEGPALDTLERVHGTLTYAEVVDALQVRFPDYDCASSYQNAFDTAFRKHGGWLLRHKAG